MADVYCFLCGANALVAEALEGEIANACDDLRPGGPPPPPSSAFHFTPEDVEWQQDLCLLGPLDEHHSELFQPLETSPDAIEAIDVKSVRLLRPIVPGGNHDYATVASPSGREYSVTGNVYPFFHAGCFEIFQTVCAQMGRESWVLPERVLWAVIRRQNLEDPAISAINGVMYGEEIDNTQGSEFVQPLANLELAGYDGIPEPILQFLQLYNDQHVPLNVLQGWWLGPAALWIFKRPDIFPIKEAYNNPFHMEPLPPSVVGTSLLERLPVELLTSIVEGFDLFTDLTALLSVSKTIRHMLLNSMDALVHKLAPEYLVPPPSLLHHLKQDPQRPPGPFPWLRYAHWCRFYSISMRNRRRIFGVCEQIVEIAKQMNDEELGQPELAADMEVE